MAEQTAEEWRGPIGGLTREQVAEFLAPGRVCRLACLDERGWPYVVPCWYEWDGEALWIIPRERSAWARFIQRDPRVAFTIDEETAPYRKFLGQGQAEVVETPNVGGKWVPIAERMSRRYLGEHGPDYLVPTLDKPRWLLRIVPTRVQTWSGVAWHPRYTAPGPQVR